MGVFGLACVLVAPGGWLSASAGAVRGQAQPADAVLALAFTAAGALIVTRRRGNGLGWLALLMGLSGAEYAADSFGRWAAGHGAPGAALAGWVGLWVWVSAWLALAETAPRRAWPAGGAPPGASAGAHGTHR